jgi:hypothetical protein
MNAVLLESVLTCPHCGFAAQETMLADARQYFYECRQCKTLLRPKPGDCNAMRATGWASRPSVNAA